MRLYKFSLLIVFLSIGISLQSQHKLSEHRIEKLILDREYTSCLDDFKTDEYPVFIGDSASDFTKTDLKLVDLGYTMYTRGKTHKLSRIEPDLKLTQVQTINSPPEYRELLIVTDTTLEKRFEMKHSYSKSANPRKDKVALLVDPIFIRGQLKQDIIEALDDRGYTVMKKHNPIIDPLKMSVQHYQKDNGLCVGEYTFEVLEHLGLESWIIEEPPFVGEDLFVQTLDTTILENGSNRPASYQTSNGLDSFNLLDSVLIKNASFEAEPRRGGEVFSKKIDDWFDCGLVYFKSESPPDIHPAPDGSWGVASPPADGETYLGMVVRDNDSWESLSQKLTSPLQKEDCYVLSVALSQSESYLSHSQLTKRRANYTTPATLRIWGANKYCGRTELLYTSEPINHSEWREYVIQFQPEQSFKYILIEAFYTVPVNRQYNGHVLVDAMSPMYKISCD